MRFLTSAIAATALLVAQASPGLAQTTTPAPAPPAVSAPAPAPAPAVPPSTTIPETTAPPAATTAPAPMPRKHAKRMSMHQRFTKANTTQDGHLTLDQANAAHWTYVARHFTAMDKDHKGYVTEADIHAYAMTQRAARRAAAKTTPPAGTPAPAAPAQ